ncbi:hypothetical protein BDM02DRAFT_3104534, partial [Thelephora ganbajun]
GSWMSVWEGNYHGDSVCIQAIRTRNEAHAKKIKSIFWHKVEGYKHFPHPNVLPVFQVSEALFPLFTMCPWMPDGSIAVHPEEP